MLITMTRGEAPLMKSSVVIMLRIISKQSSCDFLNTYKAIIVLQKKKMMSCAVKHRTDYYYTYYNGVRVSRLVGMVATHYSLMEGNL